MAKVLGWPNPRYGTHMDLQTLANSQQTQALGQAWGKVLPAGTVLLLNGNLGSGKTTFIQGLGAGLGITDAIASPTFTLINEYIEGRVPLYHIDLYRLAEPEVGALNLDLYWDSWEVEPGIVAIEWAEKLSDRPAEYIQIDLSPAGTGRTFAATATGDRHAAVLTNLRGEPPGSP